MSSKYQEMPTNLATKNIGKIIAILIFHIHMDIIWLSQYSQVVNFTYYFV